MLHLFKHTATIIRVTKTSDGAGSFIENEVEEESKGYFAILSTNEVIQNKQRGIEAEARYCTLDSMTIEDRLRYEGVIYNVVACYTVASIYSTLNYNYYDLKRIV